MLHRTLGLVPRSHLRLWAQRPLRHQSSHHKPAQKNGQQPAREDGQHQQRESQSRARSDASKGQALPAPGRGEPIQLHVGGEHGSTAKLSELGPLVVNADGTTGRVANWGEMTAMEKETTLRLLSKRNKVRLEALKTHGSTAGSGTSHHGEQ